MYFICPDVIFQILLLSFRPMTSHHVTSLSHAFFIILKEKEKKRNIKSKEKIKIKMLGPKHSITCYIYMLYIRKQYVVCKVNESEAMRR